MGTVPVDDGMQGARCESRIALCLRREALRHPHGSMGLSLRAGGRGLSDNRIMGRSKADVGLPA